TDFETRFVPQTESSAEQAFWSQYSAQPDEPNLSSTTIVEVPKELPKVSMRDTWSSQEGVPTFAELFEINNLKAQAQEKDIVILKLKEKLNSLNGDVKDGNVKRDVEENETLNIELDPKVDVAPLVLKLCKNRTAHTDYIRHTQEEATKLREIVESERILSPLNTSLVYACKYTRRIQELLMIL
nr:hypothetical protein [Tanacetum cinerariifolium]